MAKIKLVVSATIEETFADFIISKKTILFGNEIESYFFASTVDESVERLTSQK